MRVVEDESGSMVDLILLVQMVTGGRYRERRGGDRSRMVISTTLDLQFQFNSFFP